MARLRSGQLYVMFDEGCPLETEKSILMVVKGLAGFPCRGILLYSTPHSNANDFEKYYYKDFLVERRRLMAQTIKKHLRRGRDRSYCLISYEANHIESNVR